VRGIKTLNIFTREYQDALARFFPVDGEQVLKHGNENGMDYVYVNNLKSERIKLRNLLEYIILSDNPAIAESEKAFCNVSELAFSPTRELMQMQLDEFLNETGSINIEGYINFRMGEYAERINAILYSIIKKNLCKS